MKRADLQRRLDDLFERYHRPAHRGLDPIAALDGFTDIADREVVGLIASSLAYGNVKAILGGIADAIARLDGCPHGVLSGESSASIRRRFRGFRYRVTSDADMTALLLGASSTIASHGSLCRAVSRGLHSDATNITDALAKFVDEMVLAAAHPLHHLLPHPARGSACKRLMLYLRWMVRCDAIDPGGWTGITPAQLIVPLDTHLHRVALSLGLTRRRQANLRTAIEITESLKRFCPDDPLKYDFALTRPGILNQNKRLSPFNAATR